MKLSPGLVKTIGSLKLPSSPTHQALVCTRMLLFPEQQSELRLSEADFVQFSFKFFVIEMRNVLLTFPPVKQRKGRGEKTNPNKRNKSNPNKVHTAGLGWCD